MKTHQLNFFGIDLEVQVVATGYTETPEGGHWTTIYEVQNHRDMGNISITTYVEPTTINLPV